MIGDSERLSIHQFRDARRKAVQFLYQSEALKQTWFEESAFSAFAASIGVDDTLRPYLRNLCKGVVESIQDLDRLIEKHIRNYRIVRLARVELATLRVCIFEIRERTDTDAAALVYDAVEIGKEFGSTASGKFINGVLDAIARELRGKLKS